jgi:hypothetical protein
MSRVFTDENLMNWEAYASGGPFGLPDRPKVVFNCLSDPAERARYVNWQGDNAAAQQAVHGMDADELKRLLEQAWPID